MLWNPLKMLGGLTMRSDDCSRSERANRAGKVRGRRRMMKTWKTVYRRRLHDTANKLLTDLIAETAEWALGLEMANVAMEDWREERATNTRV